MNTQYISAAVEAASPSYDTLSALMAYTVSAMTGYGVGAMTIAKIGYLMMESCIIPDY